MLDTLHGLAVMMLILVLATVMGAWIGRALSGLATRRKPQETSRKEPGRPLTEKQEIDTTIIPGVEPWDARHQSPPDVDEA